MSPPAALDVDLVGVTDTSAVPVPDPLTVNGIPAWREKTAQMPTGVAAVCSSDMFKSPVRYSWMGQLEWIRWEFRNRGGLLISLLVS